MVIKNQEVVLLRAVKHEGKKQTGEPFLFYSGTFLDAESNVVRMNFNNALSANPAIQKQLETANQITVNIDFTLYQSGFNLKGTITGIDF